ncbi:alkylation response protein AidB-like acyl-CoA dehydrogenase [Paenibacillus sp. DS2015]|uniref:acyl-CoA dehydrogenase family protein n=1 Tax=Paenibacillus sp. DS2015 TaxID=3373917 RepID=UPI003D217A9F
MQDVKDTVNRVKQVFAERSAEYDRSGEFPFANYRLIVENQLHAIILPEKYNGMNLNCEGLSGMLTTLATGCGPTSLALAMHYYSLGGFKSIFSDELKDQVFPDVSQNGKFFASISNPNVLLVQDREQIRATTRLKSERVDGGFVVNGVKNYVSGSPVITYLPIYCVTTNSSRYSYGITALLSKIDCEGIKINSTWNLNAMRCTASNLVEFKNVFIPDNCLIGREGYGIEDTQDLIYWFRVAFISVYLGIAQAAFDYIVKAVHEKRDPISNKPISFLPGVQFTIAELKIKLDVCQSHLIHCAQMLDGLSSHREVEEELYLKTLISKQFITKEVNEIVWSCMQILGMESMREGHLLERLYRDVRAATFHPPSEDILKEAIGKKVLGILPMRNRWV